MTHLGPHHDGTNNPKCRGLFFVNSSTHAYKRNGWRQDVCHWEAQKERHGIKTKGQSPEKCEVGGLFKERKTEIISTWFILTEATAGEDWNGSRSLRK